MEFSPFDPKQASEEDLVAFHALDEAVTRVDRPGAPPRSYAAFVDFVNVCSIGSMPIFPWVARRDGRIIAYTLFQVPQEENTNMGIIEIHVDPGLRRQGVGTEFLRAMLREVRVLGRTRVFGANVLEGSDGEHWAKSVGLVPVHAYAVQHLNVSDTDPALWDVPVPDGYRLVQWTGRAPEEILPSYAPARHAISDAPDGDGTWQEPDWTPERVRKEEAARAEQRTEQRVVVAVHVETGETVGLTELLIRAGRPEMAHQMDTAVLRGHRGHGLGRCIKAAMMRTLVMERPEAVQVATGNAVDNLYMIRVNHQIGYKTVRTIVHFEADLEDVEKRCASTQSI
jgi:GNAT superfamily N-acetyltransferase